MLSLFYLPDSGSSGGRKTREKGRNQDSFCLVVLSLLVAQNQLHTITGFDRISVAQ